MLIHFTMIWWTRSEYMMWEPQHDAKGVTGRTDDGPDDVHGVDGKWRGRFSYSVIRIIRNWRKISTWRYFLGLCGLALPLPRFLTEVNVRLPDEPLAAHRLLRLRRVHKHTDTQASKVIVSKMKEIVLTKNKLGIQKSISMYQTLRSLLNIEHLYVEINRIKV